MPTMALPRGHHPDVLPRPSSMSYQTSVDALISPVLLVSSGVVRNTISAFAVVLGSPPAMVIPFIPHRRIYTDGQD